MSPRQVCDEEFRQLAPAVRWRLGVVMACCIGVVVVALCAAWGALV